VGLHVRTQVRAVGKSFAAMRASVRLLSGVRPEVALQQPRPAEHLSAHVTRVRQLVRQLVHRECGHADIRLTAHVAPLGRLRVQAPVRLLVPGQIRRRGVPFSTLGARVLGRSSGRSGANVGANDGRRAAGRLVADDALVAGRR